MKEIKDMIEAEANELYKSDNIPAEFWMNASKDDVIGVQLNDLSIEKQRAAYIAGRSKSIEDIRGFFEWTKAQSFHYDYRGSEFTRDNKVYKFDEVINEYFKAKQLLNKSNHG